MNTIKELGLGNSPIVLKSDQEPAIQALLERVVSSRTAPTRLEESPRGDSSSNGVVENGVRIIEAGMRALRLTIENRYGVKIPPNTISYHG